MYNKDKSLYTIEDYIYKRYIEIVKDAGKYLIGYVDDPYI